MRVFTEITDPAVVGLLQDGGVGVLRTDTLYGVVARADDKRAVERVYDLKSRTETKSPIVLIADVGQLYDTPNQETMQLITQYWPGKVSIIIPSTSAPSWIMRGNQSVAYRLPADDTLRALLGLAGPLIAPSANPEGQPPAMTIDEATAYFGDSVDFYIDSGVVQDAAPSRLLRLTDTGAIERLR